MQFIFNIVDITLKGTHVEQGHNLVAD